ncbi:hypothetical protein E8E11_006509 [Didymella keratinophila]|nr:hypothetical protein E8E11_006509 [Didymella keratinophila]
MAEAELGWADAVVVDCDDVLDSNEANIILQGEDTIAKISSWLCPADFDGEGNEYQKALASHLPGTGSWFLDSYTYRQWHDSGQHGLLWVQGLPGSGK